MIIFDTWCLSLSLSLSLFLGSCKSVQWPAVWVHPETPNGTAHPCAERTSRYSWDVHRGTDVFHSSVFHDFSTVYQGCHFSDFCWNSDFFWRSDFYFLFFVCAWIVCVATMPVNWWLSGQFWLRKSSSFKGDSSPWTLHWGAAPGPRYFPTFLNSPSGIPGL